MNPFDVINSVRSTKKYIFDESISERSYPAFIINRGLSYYRDTFAKAELLNRHPNISAKMHYDFLFNSVVKNTSKERVKWSKKEKDENISIVMEYYGYSYRKAVEALELLNNKHIAYIKQKMYKGD